MEFGGMRVEDDVVVMEAGCEHGPARLEIEACYREAVLQDGIVSGPHSAGEYAEVSSR